MSLVAAIPAGILAWLSIMAWVRFTENMGTGMMVVNGLTTAASVLVTLFPVIILVGRRRPKEGAKKGDEAGAPGADAAAMAEGDHAAQSAGTGELVDVADSEHLPLPDEADLSDSSEIEQSETDAFDFESADLDDADEPVEFEEEQK
jgi:hypothetical protein